jgi:hypothetical protein
MQPLSQAVGLAVLLGAAVWYRLYAPTVELKGVL